MPFFAVFEALTAVTARSWGTTSASSLKQAIHVPQFAPFGSVSDVAYSFAAQNVSETFGSTVMPL
jgi:hypothetical protein